MKLKKLFSSKYANRFIIVSVPFITALVVTTIVLFSRFSISESVESRVYAELKAASSMQVSSLQHHLGEQYQPLEMLDELLQSGEDFANEAMRPTLKAMMETFTLCMVGFADMDGNVTSYEGEPLGNISDRAYFYDILNGSATRKCEYLSVTKALNEPRVLFSVPAYDGNNNMIGVLFCSKEIYVLEDALFDENEILSESSGLYICDANGNVIIKNDEVAELMDRTGTDTQSVFSDLPDIGAMYRNDTQVKRVNVGDEEFYVSLVPLGTNNWMLGHLVSLNNAEKQYAPALRSVRKLSVVSIIAFLFAFAYILLISHMFFRQRRKDAQDVIRRYENYKVLLKEMNCTVVEYDLRDSSVKVISDDDDPYGIQKWEKSITAYAKNLRLHPEFDFSELQRDAMLAERTHKTHSFETLFQKNSSESFWLRIILIPVVKDDETIKLFGLALDLTDSHRSFDNILDTFKKVPGGIHRCYLNNPIHLEYYSDGMCKMLGYTKDEIRKIIGPSWDYCQLIYPEDRPIFETFVTDIAASGGEKTCEYRMLRKDGSIIEVSDTMEATQSSSGIMYGYSVVTDLRKYKQMQTDLERQLEQTQESLEMARIKNSNSQMQPHFLYNALSSIREIVLDDPEYAADLIYDFSTHLRACIRSMANDDLIPFHQELENIKAYVNIEKMRFGDKLHIRYECPEQDFHVIPLSIQPLVENAIRHGIYERGMDGGEVIVRSSSTENWYQIQVEDNGVGFDYETTMQQVHAGTRDSTGLFNLILRMEKVLKAHIAVDSKIGVGTKVTVTIPRGER